MSASKSRDKLEAMMARVLGREPRAFASALCRLTREDLERLVGAMFSYERHDRDPRGRIFAGAYARIALAALVAVERFPATTAPGPYAAAARLRVIESNLNEVWRVAMRSSLGRALARVVALARALFGIFAALRERPARRQRIAPRPPLAQILHPIFSTGPPWARLFVLSDCRVRAP